MTKKNKKSAIKIATISAIVVSATLLSIGLITLAAPGALTAFLLFFAELLPPLAYSLGALCGFMITIAPDIFGLSLIALIGSVLAHIFLPKIFDDEKPGSGAVPGAGGDSADLLIDRDLSARRSHHHHVHFNSRVDFAPTVERQLSTPTPPHLETQPGIPLAPERARASARTTAQPAVVILESRSGPSRADIFATEQRARNAERAAVAAEWNAIMANQRAMAAQTQTQTMIAPAPARFDRQAPMPQPPGQSVRLSPATTVFDRDQSASRQTFAPASTSTTPSTTRQPVRHTETTGNRAFDAGRAATGGTVPASSAAKQAFFRGLNGQSR